MTEISFGKYTSILYRYTQMMINHKLRDYGLGSGQYLFLIAIKKNPGINQRDLTTKMMNDKATTAKALQKLEELGYILRQTDDKDRRYYKIYLTERGEDFMPILRDLLKEITKTLSQGMDEEEIEQSKSLFEKMIHNASQAVSDLKA